MENEDKYLIKDVIVGTSKLIWYKLIILNHIRIMKDTVSSVWDEIGEFFK